MRLQTATKSEITMRLLSAEARVALNHIRNGNLGDDDWNKVARSMARVSSAPMFIDDSPNMTMMETPRPQAGSRRSL